MSPRLALALLVALCLAGCSTRSVVVPPEQISTLNDSKWTIQSQPR
jgi:outer membrane protein assembly factor BamE (lipoprotein component of BamABCDE complex)